MKLKFYDSSHASIRLSNTVVKLKGLPILLGEIRGDYSTTGVILSSCKRIAINSVAEAEGLDVSPVPLGFTMYRGNALYLMRRPQRRTKQGLHEGAIMCAELGRLPRLLECGDFCKSLAATITGSFPKVSTVMDMFNKDIVRSAPISRNWALNRGGVLMYKFEGPVGSFVKDQFTLDDDFKYLQETLDQEVLCSTQ